MKNTIKGYDDLTGLFKTRYYAKNMQKAMK